MKAKELMLTLTEAEFQEMIVDRARALSWRVHHDRGDYRQSIAGDPGFPDLCLARDGVVLFVEVKAEKGKTTPAQDAWIEALPGALVARPSDWDLIVSILDGEPIGHRQRPRCSRREQHHDQ